MRPEEEMKITLIIWLCSQGRPGVENDKWVSVCGMEPQPLRLYVGITRLLSQMHS